MLDKLCGLAYGSSLSHRLLQPSSQLPYYEPGQVLVIREPQIKTKVVTTCQVVEFLPYHKAVTDENGIFMG